MVESIHKKKGYGMRSREGDYYRYRFKKGLMVQPPIICYDEVRGH